MARPNSVKVNIYDEPQRDTLPARQRDEHADMRVARTKSDFVYVNRGYDGSVSTLSGAGGQRRVQPPTTVIREQYWACSRWPAFQKMLVVSVGILLGLVVGLAIWVALSNKESPPISDIFTRSHPAPD